MTRDDILATIRANEARLREFSVKELSLFGSFVRGEETDASDIDFLVEFEEKSFDNYLNTKQLLETLLTGRSISAARFNIKARLREQILSEAVRGSVTREEQRALARNPTVLEES
jgi:predicted nucleotidyltransferase